MVVDVVESVNCTASADTCFRHVPSGNRVAHLDEEQVAEPRHDGGSAGAVGRLVFRHTNQLQ